jgi:hypothetical protein
MVSRKNAATARFDLRFTKSSWIFSGFIENVDGMLYYPGKKVSHP